jgi:hypothetical protein
MKNRGYQLGSMLVLLHHPILEQKTMNEAKPEQISITALDIQRTPSFLKITIFTQYLFVNRYH